MSHPTTMPCPVTSARRLVLRMLACGLLLASSEFAFAAETAPSDPKSAETTTGSSTNTPAASKAAEAPTSAKETGTQLSPDATSIASGTNAASVSSTNEVSKKSGVASGTEDSSSGRRDDRGRDRRRRDKSSSSSDSPSSPANKGTDFASFKIITDRNIFSPSRTTPSAARSETPRQPKVDSFSLVGTMSYEKGDFAFFDGSGSEYRKVLKASDSIAGHKILSIADNEVVLESGEKKLTLKLGGQFRRVDEGPWEQKSGAAAESGDAAAKSSSSANADSTASGGGAEDEILQRLLKKREQELNNEKR